jgi:hypothetical protein
MATMLSYPTLLVVAMLVGSLRIAEAAPLKIFLLGGQSNQVGYGSIDHLDLLVQDDNEFRGALWNSTTYKVNDKVLIKFNDSHGKLTVARDSGFAGEDSFGPELMIGWTMQQEERILLLKSAFGGKSLSIDFRPPS